MTREKAIDVLQEKHDECKAFYALAAHPEEAYPGAKEYMEALQIAIAALRGPTREQVEALRGEWIKRDGYTECSKCEYWYPSGEVEEEDDRTPFCPRCGSPMTDEAVDIVMRRLEALKDEID